MNTQYGQIQIRLDMHRPDKSSMYRNEVALDSADLNQAYPAQKEAARLFFNTLLLYANLQDG